MAALTVERLLSAVRRHFGAAATIDDVVLPTLGGSNLTTIFDVLDHPGATTRRRLVSRQETYVADQHAVPPAAAAVPASRGGDEARHPLPRTDLRARAARPARARLRDGLRRWRDVPQADPHRRALRWRSRQARGSIGRGPRAAPRHPGSRGRLPHRAADSHDPLGAQLARLDSYGEAHPAVELGARWLVRNRPTTSRRQLVHGDYRTGNLLVSENGLEALLDWECAHLGSGIEDLGWLCTRSWRFGQNELPAGGFGSREQLYAAYEKMAGAPVDPAEVHWWEVFGLLRWTVLNVMQAHGHLAEGRRSVGFAACGRNASLYEYELPHDARRPLHLRDSHAAIPPRRARHPPLRARAHRGAGPAGGREGQVRSARRRLPPRDGRARAGRRSGDRSQAARPARGAPRPRRGRCAPGGPRSGARRPSAHGRARRPFRRGAGDGARAHRRWTSAS